MTIAAMQKRVKLLLKLLFSFCININWVSEPSRYQLLLKCFKATPTTRESVSEVDRNVGRKFSIHAMLKANKTSSLSGKLFKEFLSLKTIF